MTTASTPSKKVPTVRSLSKKLAQAEQKVSDLKAQIAVLRSQREIPCAACDLDHPICDLDLLCTHYHVPPSGCTDGDYWAEGEWQFVCPTSGVRNRLLFRDRRDYFERDKYGSAERRFKEMYRELFKSRSDTYQSTGEWRNNNYVDSHREEFDLPEVG